MDLHLILQILGVVGLVIFLSIPLILTFYLVTSVLAVWLGAPYVPARASAIREIVTLCQPRPGMRIVDLGSGDGRVVRALAAKGAQVDGYEIQPLLVWWSRMMSRIFRQSDNTSFYVRNLFSVDCSAYGVVVVYGFPKMMGRLAAKFVNELKPGSRVIMLDFDIPEWTADTVVEGVYIYTIHSGLEISAQKNRSLLTLGV